MKSILFLFLLTGMAFTSCLNRHFYDGWTELVSVKDTLMNDSCLVYGYARSIGEFPYRQEFIISLINTAIETTSDSSGFYLIKTVPGVYSLRCEARGNTYERMRETLRFEVRPDTKVHVDFHIGYVVD